MARSIWSGSISFGPVNVPVGMYSAIDEQDDGLLKSELGQRAKKAGISGRSKMSKDELIEALEAA
ncbi:MAG: hypothetical protein ACRDN6_10980 [Gaiellaceae bacterium]